MTNKLKAEKLTGKFIVSFGDGYDESILYDKKCLELFAEDILNELSKDKDARIAELENQIDILNDLINLSIKK